MQMGARTAVSSAVTKVQLLGRNRERSRAELKDGIANFYDKSSGLWESIWGEHMHHGYYEEQPQSLEEHKAAQVAMIDKSLEWAGVGVDAASTPKTGVDVGCGIGGSSRHIARKWGTKMQGITLSPKQCARANELAAEAGLADKCSFQVADALEQPFEDNSFDLIWSMESGEHMPLKQQFVGELARVCAPGGRVLIVTWCHRDLEEGEESLKPKEQRLLAAINKAYYLPKWCSVADYVTYCQEAGLTDVRRDDWTDKIQYFWPAVIKSSLSGRGIRGLVRAGPGIIRGALAMLLMVRGFKLNLVKFGLITARKPDDREAEPEPVLSPLSSSRMPY
ncbi:gamma-tocopherol methyltransferase [Tribonema minus]|uniref:Gamma-tocopherol methyltransferase n=1 Tax=Tribonema minus TaxID=303371 RepID=A0A836C920_9STRA|nr:gamma-tocopherol methyltransferase [Tribonema minus]